MSVRYTDYDAFAWLFATRWGSEYHAQAVTVLERLILHQLPPRAAILDLCCGDGRLARVLHEKGYCVAGIDGSDEMLDFARKRCPDIDFVAADARTFESERRFDAVVSTFDALNHVMSADDLACVCRRVHSSLKPGGYFAFDLNREEAYTVLWSRTFAEVEPEMVSVSLGSYDPGTRIAICDVTLFRLLADEWRRSDFRLSQYAHREDDVLNSLYAAGFAGAKPYDAAADLGMYGNIGQGRTFFLARRGK
jgi:SAM-dependent methyltransferase